MDYLFFDTKRLPPFMGNICEFGYVITDENYILIKKENILIKPFIGSECFKNGDDIYANLTYSEEEYENAETFAQCADKINDLLFRKDTIILGRDLKRIIPTLDIASRVGKIWNLLFTAYDIETILKTFIKNNKKKCSTNELIKELSYDCSKGLTDDRTSDYMELCSIAFKKIKENTGKTLDNLISENPKCKFVPEYYVEYFKKKSQREFRIEWQTHLWDKYCRKSHSKIADEKYDGKRFAASDTVIQRCGTSEDIIEISKERDLAIVKELKDSDYFIVLNEKDKRKNERLMKEPYKGKIILFEDFKNGFYTIN